MAVRVVERPKPIDVEQDRGDGGLVVARTSRYVASEPRVERRTVRDPGQAVHVLTAADPRSIAARRRHDREREQHRAEPRSGNRGVAQRTGERTRQQRKAVAEGRQRAPRGEKICAVDATPQRQDTERDRNEHQRGDRQIHQRYRNEPIVEQHVDPERDRTVEHDECPGQPNEVARQLDAPHEGEREPDQRREDERLQYRVQ